MQTAFEIKGKIVTIREGPTVVANGIAVLNPYSSVTYTEIVDDLYHPGDPQYQWLRLENGYCNYIFPPAGQRFTLAPLFGVMFHDHEVYGVSRPERTGAPPRTFGLPETIPLGNPQGTYLTEALQWFIFYTLKHDCDYKMTDKEVAKAQASILHSGRIMTNHGRGTDVCRDFVNDSNRNGELPRLQPMTCGGSWHQVVSARYKKYDRYNYALKVIDPIVLNSTILKAPGKRIRDKAQNVSETFNPSTNPEVFVSLTNSTRRVLGPNIRQVDPFPQLYHEDVNYIAHMPLMTYGATNFVRADRVSDLRKYDDVINHSPLVQ